MNDKLYLLVDYILNHAEDRDIDVILKAVKKRYDDRENSGAMGINPGRMAGEMASQVNSQMGFSREMVRDTVKNMARGIIGQNAPELTESQVDELLNAWVPEPGTEKVSDGSPVGSVPRDAMVVMIDQFLRYSRDLMSASEQMRIENEIPDWTSRYWEKFSPELRQIISLYLKGMIEETEFQEALKTVL